MAKLKSHTKWPPGGFQVLHPTAGMVKPFSGSFEDACVFEATFRKGNPALCAAQGWTLDPAEIADYVDDYNAARCVSGGWLTFVNLNTLATPSPSAQKKTGALASVVAVAKATRAGIGVYLDMFGPHGTPVGRSEAVARAAVCAGCPHNDVTHPLTHWFLEEASSRIMALYGIVKDMKLDTPSDAHLGVCDRCLCPLKAKVWARLDHIKRHMTADIRESLPPHCWITKG